MNKKIKKYILFLKLFTLLFISLNAVQCTNSLNKTLSNLPPQIPTTIPTTTSSKDVFVVSTLSVTASAGTTGSSSTTTPAPTPSSGNSSSSYITNLFFSTTKSTVPILNHCTLSTSRTNPKPCLCQFSWNEINPNAGSNSSIPREIQTQAITVQPYYIRCPAPSVYATEIPDGTQIQITLIGGTSNPDVSLFTMTPYTYTKNTAAIVGSFQDSQGRMFDNVLHYTCYQTLIRGLTIQNKTSVQTNSTTGETINALVGTQFCVSLANQTGSTTSSTACPNLPSASYSSQAYYYNLYIRNSQKGNINFFNESFICPMVQESLNSTGTLGSQGQAWPLDSNFALAITPNSTFSVGVISNSQLAIGSTSNTQNTTCFGTSTSTSSSSANTFITSCLGFAAQVNADGTCPTFRNANGQIQATYRLRRYLSLYPRIFDTDGHPIQNLAQAVDTIYVLDRPVNTPAQTNSEQSYTMLGPKPCPFAYFDKKGVANLPVLGPTPIPYPTPSYVATSFSGWNYKNVDGIELPNFDSLPSAQIASCSASLPTVNIDQTAFNIVTVNINSTKLQHVYVRPTTAFLPHYEEDTTFQACAPQSSEFQDPPLHFARDPVSGNIAWCAESYPTQNPNIANLDPPVFPTPTSPTATAATGLIAPFTSHRVKNTTSRSCTATPIFLNSTSSYLYPSCPSSAHRPPVPGYARHCPTIYWDYVIKNGNLNGNASQTCDRTVVSQGLAWTQFPLLAAASDIESAIIMDSSYQCQITYDNKGTKSASKLSPSSGCCNSSSVNVTTGIDATTPNVGHLEPDVACQIPSY